MSDPSAAAGPTGDRPADRRTEPRADTVAAVASDSAGVPWGGRTLPRGDFAGDDGAADPALRRALDDLDRGATDDAAVVRALAASRVLVPVVAVRTDEAGTVHGTADKQADLALVTLTGRDGRRALPVFSSVQTLAVWDPTARPVAVAGRRAAASAVAEGCDLVVVDAAGPVTFVVSRPALWAIGQGRPWVPAHEDPEVLAELHRAVADEPAVAAVAGEPGGGTQLRVVLRVRPGLDTEQVAALARRVAEALRGSAVLTERVDGLELQVLPA